MNLPKAVTPYWKLTARKFSDIWSLLPAHSPEKSQDTLCVFVSREVQQMLWIQEQTYSVVKEPGFK